MEVNGDAGYDFDAHAVVWSCKGRTLSAVFYYPHILRRYTIFKDSPLEICG